MAELLGDVMGIVFLRPNHPTAYVAGDTIWNKNVEDALARYQPDVVFLNTGYAQVNGFDGSIIMGKDDVARATGSRPRPVSSAFTWNQLITPCSRARNCAPLSTRRNWISGESWYPTMGRAIDSEQRTGAIVFTQCFNQGVHREQY